MFCRGNFETIHTRIQVLNRINNFLKSNSLGYFGYGEWMLNKFTENSNNHSLKYLLEYLQYSFIPSSSHDNSEILTFFKNSSLPLYSPILDLLNIHRININTLLDYNPVLILFHSPFFLYEILISEYVSLFSEIGGSEKLEKLDFDDKKVQKNCLNDNLYELILRYYIVLKNYSIIVDKSKVKKSKFKNILSKYVKYNTNNIFSSFITSLKIRWKEEMSLDSKSGKQINIIDESDDLYENIIDSQENGNDSVPSWNNLVERFSSFFKVDSCTFSLLPSSDSFSNEENKNCEISDRSGEKLLSSHSTDEIIPLPPKFLDEISIEPCKLNLFCISYSLSLLSFLKNFFYSTSLYFIASHENSEKQKEGKPSESNFLVINSSSSLVYFIYRDCCYSLIELLTSTSEPCIPLIISLLLSINDLYSFYSNENSNKFHCLFFFSSRVFSSLFSSLLSHTLFLLSSETLSKSSSFSLSSNFITSKSSISSFLLNHVSPILISSFSSLLASASSADYFLLMSISSYSFPFVRVVASTTQIDPQVFLLS
jgi:hypothetical protein